MNGITKVKIPGMDNPILFVINYATLIEDDNECESLCQPFNLMANGIKLDMTPEKYGGQQCLTMDDVVLPMKYDGEKLYFTISKPTDDEIKNLETFELTSPYSNDLLRRNKLTKHSTNIPMMEWRKRLAMAPEDIVAKTLENTSQFYLTLPGDERQDMRDHYVSRTPGLRYPRQNEVVSSDTFSPSVRSDRGNTCSQLFSGNTTDFWAVYPLKTESKNTEALQDYTRTYGCPNVIKTDNAQSELGTG